MKVARAVGIFQLLVAVAACGAAGDAVDDSGEAVTDIPRTSPRDQKETGNCWLYATAAWAESLERSAVTVTSGTHEAMHFAPTYWDYWDWYAKITHGEIHGKTSQAVKDELDSGGSWGSAVELILARGLVRDPDFIGDGAATDAKATGAALRTLATSLTSGPLSSSPARRDGALVRRELERAFRLGAGVAAALTRVFGEDGEATLDNGAEAQGIVVDAEHVSVLHPRANGASILGTLREAIGDRVRGSNPDHRKGQFAWDDVVYDAKTPAARRAFFRRIQRALHAGAPLPIGWFWADNADPNDDGAFTRVPAKPASDANSVDHETLLYDYEVRDVPGYGRLPAGTRATPAQEEAALAEDAKIVFLRAKDSYYAYRTGKNARIGYTDLYLDYLTGTVRVCPSGVSATSSKCHDTVPLEDVTFPPGF